MFIALLRSEVFLIPLLNSPLIMSSTTSKKNILILGATGPTGITTVRKAIQRGHKITIFARNIGKLPKDMRENPELAVCICASSPTYGGRSSLDHRMAVVFDGYSISPSADFRCHYFNPRAYWASLHRNPRRRVLSTAPQPSTYSTR